MYLDEGKTFGIANESILVGFAARGMTEFSGIHGYSRNLEYINTTYISDQLFYIHLQNEGLI